ncbi:hypothetical protein BJ166DRAFT_626961 [Pestalotiopsis sp. NC0098]|nr:hypothetical protein BJ166DRAFT_626961 [Pestalotiopsis sp. NC0098]
MSAEFYYWRTVLVIIPSQETFKFLSSSSGFAFSGGRREFIEFQQCDPTRGLLRWYKIMCLRHAKPTYIEAFNTLCKKLEDRRKLGAQKTNATATPRPAKPIKPTSEEMMDALKIALICKKHESLDSILKNMKKDPPLEFFTWMRERFNSEDVTVPWLKFKTPLLRLFYNVEPGLCIRIRERYEIMNKLFPPTVSMSNELKSVVSSMVDESVAMLKRRASGPWGNGHSFSDHELRIADATALFEMTLSYMGFNYIKTRVVPDLASMPTPFQLEFYKTLRQGIERDEILRTDALPALHTLARKIINMDLTTTAGPCSEPEPDVPSYMWQSSRIPAARIVRPETLVDFVDTLLEFGLDEDLEAFSHRLANAHGYIPVREYNTLYIPLLLGLVKLFEKRNIPLLQYGLPTLFWRMLNAYIWTFVGGEPKRDNWIRPRTACVCNDCDEMNRFLQDPFVEVGKFTVNKQRRDHLSSQLSHAESDCETTVVPSNQPSHALQVTKKLKNQEANMVTWAANRAVAEKNIAAFDQGHLRLLLGSFYDDITTMSKLSSSHEAYRAAGPPKYALDYGKRTAGSSYHGTSVSYGGNSAYSRALSYTQHNPPVGANPAMSYPGLPPPAAPLGPSSRGNIGPPVVTAPKPPMRPTDLPAPNLYPVYTETATRPSQPPPAPPYRAPLAEVSRNETEWEKVARLQDEIAIAGGITPPSKKRKAAALAFGDENATATQNNMPPSAGAKRRATEFIDLTSDGN